MGEPWIELAMVEVRVVYDQSATGDMVVRSRVYLDFAGSPGDREAQREKQCRSSSRS